MQDLDIDTDEMRNINKTLCQTVDNLPDEIKYSDSRIKNTNVISDLSSINNSISNSINSVNGSVKSVKNKIDELLESSNYYILKIEEADNKPLVPSELSNDLEKRVDDIKTPDPLDYGNINTNNNGYNYNNSLIGSMSIDDKKYGTLQGLTQAFGPDGSSYLVVTSYTKDNGYIQIYDSLGQLIKVYNVGHKSHMGGVAYQNGNLIVADQGVSTYNFYDMISNDNDSVDGGTVNRIDNVPVNATGQNNTGGASFLSIDSSGQIVVGSFHSSAGNFDTNPSSSLLFYNIDENGNFVANENGEYLQGVIDANSSSGRSSSNQISNSNISGFTELQGMCSQTLFGLEQSIFTSSYFANQNGAQSTIIVANHGTNENFNESDIMYTNRTLPPGAEQIIRLSDGNFAIIYEPHGNPRIDFISADYFMQSSSPEFNSWKTDNWKDVNTYESDNGEIYIGNMAMPLSLLNNMKTEIGGLKNKLNNSCDVKEALECTSTGTLETSYSDLQTQIGVLEDIMNNLSRQIWEVTNQYKQTDEQ